MRKAYKGSEEFPTDGILKMLPTETAVFKRQATFYNTMFLDAYVATIQCEALLHVDKVSETQTIKMSQAIFICYHHYVRSGETFYLGDAVLEAYNYRSVQRDSVRCLLLWLPVGLKSYLMEVIKKPADKVVPKDVS
jgi:hypothetical protein